MFWEVPPGPTHDSPEGGLSAEAPVAIHVVAGRLVWEISFLIKWTQYAVS